MNRMARWTAFFAVAALGIGWGGGFAAAEELAAQRGPQTASIGGRTDGFEISGTGDVTADTQEVGVNVQQHNLFGTPFTASAGGRVGQEKFRNYDLDRWGADVGMGWALDEKTNLRGLYRFDRYSVFNVTRQTDRAIRNFDGRTDVAALGLFLDHDTRDSLEQATAGRFARGLLELASTSFGEDADFVRLDGEAAFYWTPFADSDGWWREVTFVEHLQAGWVEEIGDSDAVPFFERYFVGGASTVRGHRARWLSPRGDGEQHVGGEAQFVNNIEARLPLLPEKFNRRLSTALFFDMGRSYRSFSDLGDFGYGAGAGLRYLVKMGFIEGTLRADYGFNLAPEGDDSRSRLHIAFGIPF